VGEKRSSILYASNPAKKNVLPICKMTRDMERKRMLKSTQRGRVSTKKAIEGWDRQMDCMHSFNLFGENNRGTKKRTSFMEKKERLISVLSATRVGAVGRVKTRPKITAHLHESK